VDLSKSEPGRNKVCSFDRSTKIYIFKENKPVHPPTFNLHRQARFKSIYAYNTERKKPRRGAGKALVLKIFNVHFFIVIFIFNWKSRDKYLANACKRILTSFD
jgi:hypothetical protein